MKKQRLLSALIAVCVFFSSLCPCAFALEDEDNEGIAAPETTARSVLVGDADSGRIFYAANAYTRSEPASITKIMTLLLAVEAIERGDAALDDMVTASENCRCDLTEDSSNAQIYKNETMSLKDLLYCAALVSANEACNIIAEHISASIQAFVERMNQRAKELGCNGTSFANPHGLPDANHYTTAHDLFVIACEGMRHELFRTLVGTASYTAAATNSNAERVLKNSNALINKDSVYGEQYIYKSATGIKTGHTDAAGYCLVSSAEKNGLKLISVVLGAEGDKVNGDYFNNFADAISLFDWVFDNFKLRKIVAKDALVGTQKVTDGSAEGEIDICTAEALNAVAHKGLSFKTIKKSISLYENIVSLPIEAGTEVGVLTVSDSFGNEIGSVKLVTVGTPRFVTEETPVPTEAPQSSISHEQQLAMIIVGGLLLLLIIITVSAAIARRHKKQGKPVKKTAPKGNKR